MIAITFRTDDGERWGAGKGANLDPGEVDLNFWGLKSALEDFLANPPSPVQIASFTVAGAGMTIHLTNGNAVGPLPLPILAWRWRADWAASVPYLQLDVFRVADDGIYLVLLDHTSAGSFDPAAVDGMGNPLYQKLFPLQPAPPLPLFYDFAGIPGASANRNLVVPFGGTLLANALCYTATPATADAVFTLNVLSGSFTTGTGTLTLSAGDFVDGNGTVTISEMSPPIVVLGGDMVQLVAPASPDATLADVSFTLLLTPS